MKRCWNLGRDHLTLPNEFGGRKSKSARSNWNGGQQGLLLLLEAHEHALDVNRCLWDFAVHIVDLKDAGISTSNLRWLLCKGYLEHARERSLIGALNRSFHPDSGLVFSPRTCFVLTPAGVAFARQTLGCRVDHPVFNGILPDQSPIKIPHWDRSRQRLTLAGLIVKEYKVPAGNQGSILDAFEEEGWPARVDDPLWLTPDIDPKRRLHDTINSLNRHQKHSLLRFLGDGTGTGIRWELTDLLQEKTTTLEERRHSQGSLNGQLDESIRRCVTAARAANGEVM